MQEEDRGAERVERQWVLEDKNEVIVFRLMPKNKVVNDQLLRTQIDSLYNIRVNNNTIYVIQHG